MSILKALQDEIASYTVSGVFVRNVHLAAGYRAHFDDPNAIARAYAIRSLLADGCKHLYRHDLIAGSVRGLHSEVYTQAEVDHASAAVNSYGGRHFGQNSDHFAPDYAGALEEGISGLLAKIARSREEHASDPDYVSKMIFLSAMEISLNGLIDMAKTYAEAADEMAREDSDPAVRAEMAEIASSCRAIAWKRPESFRQALQLVWLIHQSFVWEGKYAMALGRLDQYLYPFYCGDIERGILTPDRARELLASVFCKIIETGDIVNIAIGGLMRDGGDAVNELSYQVLGAVGDCNIPGPNLSARLHRTVPDAFTDACLRLIGTGIGYPALMNDEANTAALERLGYAAEDCRDYCMVGCIENFIAGAQPPWSDGRFNTPKYLELALNGGVDMLTGVYTGVKTPPAEEIGSMEELTDAFLCQLRFGASEYAAFFHNENDRLNPSNYTQPYLSCFTRDCIGRAQDVNAGGALYPSVHGAACMGIATVADSLAAIDDVVFGRGLFSLAGLRDMLRADFEGYEAERALLLNAPKYGNDDWRADQYAVWYVDAMHGVFSRHRTRDGGAFYTLMASNITNIWAGGEIAATPDGRRARTPLSDAGSPMRGMDRNGPTALVNSVTRPDYSKVAGGSVVNLKFSPEMFTDPKKRALLLWLVKSYINKGGQEMQINSISREILMDARDNPGAYSDLVVRVSGFSAFYTQLDPRVQKDILDRTEQG